MKFCTTCGRTYEEPEIDMCPHDGTPLFGMAGSEGDDLPDEDAEVGNPSLLVSAAGDSGPADNEVVADTPEDEPLVAGDEPSLPETEFPELELPARAEDEHLFAPEDEDEAQEDELFVPAADLPESEPSLPSPFDDEPSEPSLEQSEPEDEVDLPVAAEPRGIDALPDAPLSSDSLFDESVEQNEAALPNYEIELPGADDAASLQISEALDHTLDDLGEDSAPVGDTSLEAEYAPTSSSIPIEDADPYAARPARNEGGRSGLVGLLLVILIIAAAVGWYFTMGPGATPETPTTPDATLTTPDVTPEPPTTPDPVVAPMASPDAGMATPDAGMAAPDAGTMAPDMAAPAAEVPTDTTPKLPPPVEPVKQDPAPRKVTPKATTPKKDPTPKATAPKQDTPPAEKTPEPPQEKSAEELNNELNNLLP